MDGQAQMELFRMHSQQIEGVQVKELNARHRAAFAEAFNVGKAATRSRQHLCLPHWQTRS